MQEQEKQRTILCSNNITQIVGMTILILGSMMVWFLVLLLWTYLHYSTYGHRFECNNEGYFGEKVLDFCALV